MEQFNSPWLLSFYTLGPVTEVKTDIYVTSFGPVSDVEMVSMSMSIMIGLRKKKNKPSTKFVTK